MKALALLALLLVPVALALPHAAAPRATPAVPTEVSFTSESGGGPDHLLRVRLNNTGGAGSAILEVKTKDGSVLMLQKLDLAAGEQRTFELAGNPTTYTVDYRLPLAESISTIDLGACPRIAGEVDIESSASLLQEMVGGGHHCLAGKA
ncbi:MAG: hypothetical protein QOE90_1074 [Thermoplasmata archaeon]|jgi:hypothetical protein|nr:hypothetical protein [Thermoplasmata archaeon]